MTRANLNFMWQPTGSNPQCLHYYWNGDQYPTGLRDFFKVGEWLGQANAFNPEGFKNWIKNAYRGFVETEDKRAGTNDLKTYQDADFVPHLISHPCIHYDEAGFLTDYSYIFEEGLILREKKLKDGRMAMRFLNGVKVYQWDKLIFTGTVDQFLKWLAKLTR